MKLKTLVAAASMILFPAWGLAEVADSSSTGFTVKTSLNIQSSPEEVYRRLVRNVGEWWNPVHTFSGDAHNLTIEEKPMGCFCETLPNQGAVRHMQLVRFASGKVLVLSGALGPLQSLAVTGTMTIQIAAADSGTKLDVVYAVAGYLPAGMNTWATPVDSVIAEQFARLKNYVEHGVAAPPIQTPPAN